MKMKLTFQAGIHVAESETDYRPQDVRNLDDMRRVFYTLVAEVVRAMTIVLQCDEGAEK